jgi:uncharacterized membrane protein YhaH (DUF805 family)
MQEISPIEWAMRPIRKYAVFSGRASRAEYWWFYLLTIVVNLGSKLFDRILGTDDVIGGLLGLILLLPWVSVTVRRLHDTDRSGWWAVTLVGAVTAIIIVAVMAGAMGADESGPIVAIVVAALALLGLSITMLVFMAQSGTDGPNRYGPDPYGPGELEEVFA